MLVVTHEMAFAREISDRVVFMDEGAVIEIAPPETLFTAPKQARVQSFLERLLKR
jgi:ABC-type polar amino acid transport system ATPase subunit